MRKKGVEKTQQFMLNPAKLVTQLTLVDFFNSYITRHYANKCILYIDSSF